ncbi:DinB family protein [Cohnella rhizosphaerae]|uniref:DinB family protein n=1 Tax=Cohnella rhizosphaerae TaxID=1457232 RepID=A0A9X4KV43_9BACL|nr:DinB family protein [Cohnella rhizosphaerae]MDG0811731.1 DinB family protein [Cohnella rhizosphaerae]
MFTSIESFIQEWENESARTRRLLETLTDASLSQSVGEGFRTLGRLAWHLTCSPQEMLVRTGLSLPAPGDEHIVPGSAAEIAAAYARTAREVSDAVRAQWTDANLTASSDMYGEQWPNGLTLRAVIQHEVHHRGQMTVLMRQAGLSVPGVYGPAREEWAAMGMEPPVV